MRTVYLLAVVQVGICGIVTGAEPANEPNGDVVRVAAKALLANYTRSDRDPQEVSRAWAKVFLKTFDPHRMHFLATDIDELSQSTDSLLAETQQGKVEFAHQVQSRFQLRLGENTALIKRLLAAQHDFTLDESVRVNHDNYAKDKTECDERWRKRINYELLMEKQLDANRSSSRDFLRARYSRIEKHFGSLKQSDCLSLFLDALARSLDPHSAYMDESFLRMFRTSLIQNYTLGLALAYRDGDLWILPSVLGTRGKTISSELRETLAGCRIVAIRVKGEEPIHLTGLTGDTAFRTIISSIGELGNSKTVILEVDDPQLGKRISVPVKRWNSR